MPYFDYLVPIPGDRGITVKKIGKKKIPYVYYNYDRYYDREKGYTVPRNVCIGRKGPPEYPDEMYPNENFYQYFQAEMPSEAEKEQQRKEVQEKAAFKRRQIYRLLGVAKELYQDLAAYCRENQQLLAEDFALPEVPESWTREQNG